MKGASLVPLLLILATQVVYGQDTVIGPKGIGAIALCSPMRNLRKAYPQARDTVMESEGQEWQAKQIPLGSGEWILAEASWVDATRIWRLTTNATRYVTINGIHIGDRIQALVDKRYDIDFNEGDGEYAFELISPAFSFSFTTESRYAKAFYEVISHGTGHKKAIEVLNPVARIVTITVSGDCGELPK